MLFSYFPRERRKIFLIMSISYFSRVFLLLNKAERRNKNLKDLKEILNIMLFAGKLSAYVKKKNETKNTSWNLQKETRTAT